MQVVQVCQVLLAVSVAITTLSLTAGFNCSKCEDIENVQIIRNTIPGFNFAVGSLRLPPRSLLCKTSKNGEDVTGVSIVDCPRKSEGGSRDNRCVYYHGLLNMSIKVNQGSSSGEVNVGYFGTYRDCVLEKISASGSCLDQITVLPDDNNLRVVALKTSPNNLSSYSVTVEFKGEKCVSDMKGMFQNVNKSPLIVEMTGCNIFAIVVSYIISKEFF